MLNNQKSLGSAKSVEVSQSLIPRALNKLEECIEQAKQLKSNAVEKFAEQTNTILELAGDKAAKVIFKC